MRKLIFLLPVLLLMFLPGCKSNVIKEDKFVFIYSELLIAQDTVGTDSIRFEPVKQNILKKNNVTWNEYKATVSYYNEDAERWEKFFDKVTAYLEEQQKKHRK